MTRANRILIVDDDPVATHLTKHVAQTLGCVALEARTTREATRLLEERQPNLVILDGLLPDGDGIRWLRKLRSDGNLVKVVFSSSFWRDVASHRMLIDELGVTAVLPKPARPEVLAKSITDALDKPSVRGAAPQ